MFRDVARKKQSLPKEDCIEILKSQVRGVLSIQGDDGYPYGLPMNHWYNEADGKVYFHSGKYGHKIDSLARCGKVSFCVMDEGTSQPDHWSKDFRSVIVFGKLEILKDHEKAIEMVKKLSYHFVNDAAYIEAEIRQSGVNTLCLCLTPEHMTGKLVHEK